MKVGPPPLLPLLRSATQGQLLTMVLLHSDREFSLSELTSQVDRSLPTVAREIDRAEQAGIVTSRTVGATRLVRANTRSVLYGPLSDLLLLTFGPAPVLAEELSRIEGIAAAYIFGSWAARYQGQAGPAPRDIDVLILGAPDRDEVYDAAERAERRLRRPVQAVFRSPEEWARPERDSFLLELRNRPLVRILPTNGDEE